MFVNSGPAIKPPVANEWSIQNNSWYYAKDGKFVTNDWLNHAGKWYYFDSTGKMRTGWINWNNNWYFLHADGAMATDWVYVNNKWYYLLSDGRMAANSWIDNTYFVGADGAMYVNARTPDGYNVDSNGRYVGSMINNISSKENSIKTSNAEIARGKTAYANILLSGKSYTVIDTKYRTRSGLGLAGRIKDAGDLPERIYVHATNIDISDDNISYKDRGVYELKNRKIKVLREYNKANKSKDDSGNVNRYKLSNGKYAHARYDVDVPIFDTKTEYYGSLFVREDAAVMYYNSDTGRYEEVSYDEFIESSNRNISDEELQNAVITQIDDLGYITGLYVDTIN